MDERGAMQFVEYEAARRGVRLDTHGIARYGHRHYQWHIWVQIVPELASMFPDYFDWSKWGITTPAHPWLEKGWVPVRVYSPETREEYGLWYPLDDITVFRDQSNPQTVSPQELLHWLRL